MVRSRLVMASLTSYVLLVGTMLMIPTRTTLAEMLDPDTAASYFGQSPAVWGMRMSPDGKRVSFLKSHPQGFPIAMQIDLTTGKPNLVMSSDPKKGMDIAGCFWANETRILCTFFGIKEDHVAKTGLVPHTRLVGVNADGTDMKVLIQSHQKKGRLGDELRWSNDQASIVDMLRDDPKHVLVMEREKNGMGVSRLDVDRNRLKTVIRPKQGVWRYMSDGQGEVRLRSDGDRTRVAIEYRLTGEDRWHRLTQYEADERSPYEVAAIYPGANKILVWDEQDGKRVLLEEQLLEDPSADRPRKVVFAHETVDVGRIAFLSGRPIGVQFTTDRTYVEYFDADVKAIARKMAYELGNVDLRFVDESRDRRFYLVHASSDVDSGAYYRFDRETETVAMVTRMYPWLEERHDLAEMESVEYAAPDGAMIPAFVTIPSGREGARVPLVVLPHGGPWSRDQLGFAPLPQLFAAQGYAVLQSNYRGSVGYGAEWEGDGAFKGWRQVVKDIAAGVDHLVAEGHVDPERVCAVGWSFGGYAALMSAIEESGRYRCVVSIAGVSDPYRLYSDAPQDSSYGRLRLRELVPTKGEEVRASSALDRAGEIDVPTLLFHGDRDLNVPVDHSQDLEKAIRRAEGSVEYVEYEQADHQIRRPTQLIDMYQRIGAFLAEHLAKKPKVASAAN